VFDQTIRRLLSLFPRGATDVQLISHLNASGIRLNPSEFLDSLKTLAERGEIIRDPANRWQVPRKQEVPPAKEGSRETVPSPGNSPTSSRLTAVDATWHQAPPTTPAEGTSPPEQGSPGSTALPEWTALL